MGASLAVKMDTNETSILSKDGVIHRFLYDFSFWSFDEEQQVYADQSAVYKSLAQPLLDWSFEGYNTCLFAYGQVNIYVYLNICVVCFMLLLLCQVYMSSKRIELYKFNLKIKRQSTIPSYYYSLFSASPCRQVQVNPIGEYVCMFVNV